MKNYKYWGFILAAIFLFASCSDDIKYVDSKDPASIFIKGIEANTVNIYTTQTHQIEMGVLPTDANIKDAIKYVYSSSNKKIFEVSQTGLITTKLEGQAILTITASNYEGLTTKAVVSVKDEVFAVEEIKLAEGLENLVLTPNSETVVAMSFNLGGKFTVLPQHASCKDVEFISSDEKIATVSDEGNIQAIAIGKATITIKAKDGSGVSKNIAVEIKEPTAYKSLDRKAWTLETSHVLPVDASISNAPESLIDGNPATCLSMVKPGKSYGGIKVEKDEEIFFVIDRKDKEEFDYVSIQHRNNPYKYLRPYTYTLYGKDEASEDFVHVSTTIDALVTVDRFVMTISPTKYRYVKFVITADTENTAGSTMQIAELEMGKISY